MLGTIKKGYSTHSTYSGRHEHEINLIHTLYGITYLQKYCAMKNVIFFFCIFRMYQICIIDLIYIHGPRCPTRFSIEYIWFFVVVVVFNCIPRCYLSILTFNLFNTPNTPICFSKKFVVDFLFIVVCCTFICLFYV